MWTYVQSNGALLRNGVLIAFGYSGGGAGKNNPAFEADVDVGPIPAGLWQICGPPYDTAQHGPYVLRLEPQPATATFGRAGFLMHGDSILAPGTASQGCIVMDRRTRSDVWQSGDSQLQVVAEPPVPEPVSAPQ